jgi:hypothetical protein
MNMTRLQAWALLLILPLDVIAVVGANIPLLATLSSLTVLLFIFGIPGVRTVQPMGTAGLVGILALELAALIALGINFAGLPGSLAIVSVLAGALGRIIVGWLTTQQKVFASWVGWLFLAMGVLNLTGYFFLSNSASFGSTLGTAVFLLEDLALFGYGQGIAKKVS